MTSEYQQALYDLRDALKMLERELGNAADTCERIARKGGRHGLYGDLGNSGIGGERAAGDSIADHKN
jgi:hypothetical protein